QVHDGDLVPAPTAVAVPGPELDAAGGAGLRHDRAQQPVGGVLVVGMDVVEPAPGQVLRGRIAHDLLHAGADVDHFPLGVNHADHVGGVLHERAEALLALADGQLRSPT